MKKLQRYFVGALLLLSSHIGAQNVAEGETAVVYYLPQASYEVTVTCQVKECTAGPLAQYAEEMLGFSEAPLEDHNEYYLRELSCQLVSEADLSRPHKVLPMAGYDMQLISLFPDGQLRGYNLPVGEQKSNRRSKKEPDSESKLPRVPAYPEEALMAQTERERAEAVRDQIMHLREARFYLLVGESEHAPQDGKQLEILLDEINNQEKRLTKLFVGSYKWVTREYTLTMDAAKPGETILGRWNNEEGLVAPDMEGTPIRIINRVERLYPVVQPDAKPNKKAPKPSAIVSIQPGRAEMELYVGEKRYDTQRVLVPQLGFEVPFTIDLFKTGNTNHIVLSETTGDVISIYQK